MSNHVPPRLRAILTEHGSGPEYALVDCIDCPASARVNHSATLSTAQLVDAFQQLGWTIRPTRCPACVTAAADVAVLTCAPWRNGAAAVPAATMQ